jgi:DNA-binding winged helix-turn-helix (wHTH) protein/tetratricopeptide (TPR) repeat protein
VADLPDPVPARLLRFGVFELDLEACELRKSGRLIAIALQPFAVLAMLAGRPGEVVTREELRRELWGEDTHVDFDAGLNRCLSALRRVLGDSAHAPRFVETVPRRGYRFLVPVQRVTPPVPASAAPVVPAARVRSIVLGMLAALALQTAGMARTSEAGKPGLPSPVLDAQSDFEKGRRAIDEGPAGWRRSVALFTRAAQRDPGFALARYGLADAYLRMAENGVLDADQAYPAARAAAIDALRIEDRAEVRLVLAAVRLHYEFDWAGAERELLRARSLDPNLLSGAAAWAEYLSARGRHDEAVAAMKAAETREPACGEVLDDVALALYRARRLDEAEHRWRRWAEMEPDHVRPHYRLLFLYRREGRMEEAAREVQAVLERVKAPAAMRAAMAAGPASARVPRYLRGRLAALGRPGQAQPASLVERATLAAHLGEAAQALDLLEAAERARRPSLLASLAGPDFDGLRWEPRFAALLSRIGLAGPPPRS